MIIIPSFVFQTEGYFFQFFFFLSSDVFFWGFWGWLLGEFEISKIPIKYEMFWKFEWELSNRSVNDIQKSSSNWTAVYAQKL